MLPLFRSDGVLENKFPPKPVEGALNKFDWPNPDAFCPKADEACPKADEVCTKAGGVCPKGELVCPSVGVDDWNNGEDWVLPNADVVPWADVGPKIDGDPKGDELEVLKIEGGVLDPNVWVVEPNKEGVAVDVEPKRLDVLDVPKAEEPNAEVDGLLNTGVFEANGLEDVEDEKGFADDWPNAGVDEDAKPELPNPTVAVAWPAGAGPPVFSTARASVIHYAEQYFGVQDITNFNRQSTFISQLVILPSKFFMAFIFVDRHGRNRF